MARRSVCDEVYEQLAGNIVRGEAKAGSSLLSERRLAEVLGVSRPIVREALQRLANAGLVEVRQGGSTTVRDFRRHAGLNVLAQLLLAGDRLDLSVARSLLEARFFIGPQVAALAAERSGAKLSAQLGTAIAQIEGEADPVAQQWHALSYWDVLVDGAESIVFRLMFNGMRAAYEPMISALTPMMRVETGLADPWRVLADAVTGADAEAARQAAVELLSPSTNALMQAIERLEAQS